MNQIINSTLNDIAKILLNKNDTDSRTLGLYDGQFGKLIYLAYFSKYRKDDSINILFNKQLDVFLESFSRGCYTPTFCSGISGILYGLTLLNQYELIDVDISNTEIIFESYLSNALIHYINVQEYDFMHGALGIGVFFLKSKNNYTKQLSYIISYLNSTSIIEDNKIKWISHINKARKDEYNISLSHGISSIVIFLCMAYQKNIMTDISKKLIIGAINYILSQEINFLEYNSCFVSTSKESQGYIKKSRLGWCYGDLGIALALWKAGHTLNNNAWNNKAVYILEQASTRRSLPENYINDMFICHGTSGVAHIFNHMYLETSNNKFKQAAEYWINQTIMYYTSYNQQSTLNKGYDYYCLLEGISGVGLVLLSYMNSDISWDEILLLS
jgi:lantibiotic modifying enzyme